MATTKQINEVTGSLKMDEINKIEVCPTSHALQKTPFSCSFDRYNKANSIVLHFFQPFTVHVIFSLHDLIKYQPNDIPVIPSNKVSLLFDNDYCFCGIKIRNIRYKMHSKNYSSFFNFNDFIFSLTLVKESTAECRLEVVATHVRRYHALGWDIRGTTARISQSDGKKFKEFLDCMFPNEPNLLDSVISTQQDMLTLASKNTYQSGVSLGILQNCIYSTIKPPIEKATEEILSTTIDKTFLKFDSFIDIALIFGGVTGLSEFLYGVYIDDHNYIRDGSLKLGVLGVFALIKNKWKWQSGFVLDDIDRFFKESVLDVFSQLFKMEHLNKTKKYLDLLVSFDKASVTLHKIAIWIVTNVNKLAQYLFDTEVVPVSFLANTISHGQIRTYLKKCSTFVEDVDKGSLIPSVDLYNSCELLVEEGYELQGLSGRDTPGRTLLNSLLEKLDLIKNSLISMNPQLGGVRVEPVGIMLRGGAGNLKSKMISHFVCAMKHRYAKIGQKDIFAYHRNPTASYYDGYLTGTKIMVMDDFGQSVDVPGSIDNEYLNLIHVINTVPLMLNMADLKNKGRTFCNVDLVFLSTNVDSFKPASIISKQALERRFHLDFTMSPKPEYCVDPTADRMSRKYDLSKAPSDMDGVAKYDTSHFEFYCRRTFRVYSFDEVCELIWNSKELHEEHYKYAKEVDARIAEKEESDEINMIDLDSPEINYIVSHLKGCDSDIARKIVAVNKSTFKKSSASSWYSKFSSLYSSSIKKYRTTCDNLSTELKDTIVKFSSSLPENSYSRLLAVLAGVIPIISIVGLMAVSSSKSGNDQLANIDQSFLIPGKKNELKAQVRPVVQQMGFSEDPSGYERIKSLLKKNQYTLTNEDIHYGFVLGIRGRIVLMNGHFRDIIQKITEKNKEYLDDADLTFTKTTVTKRQYKFSFRQFLACPWSSVGTGKDAILVELPEGFEVNRDIISFFKTDDMLQNSYNQSGLICKLSKDVSEYNLVSVKSQRVDGYEVSDHTRNNVYIYQYGTKQGDCGALLVDLNPRVQKEKIIGIHSAGDCSVQGMATPITQNELISAFSNFSEDSKICPQSSPGDYQMGTFPYEDVFVPIRKVESIAVAGSSSFVKSPSIFHGMFGEPTEVPTNCNPNKLRLSLIGYNQNTYPKVNPDLLRESIEAESDFIYRVSNIDGPRRVLTESEIVFGVDEIPVPTLNRKTSCGYPWVKNRRLPGKQDWLGKEVDMNIDNDNWRSLMKTIEQHKLAMVERRERPIFAFMMTLKDEVRKIGKPPRIFGGGPIDCLVMCQMYFGAFVGWYHANKIQNGSTLGINPYSGDWSALAQFLRNGHGKVLSGDFSGFDKRQDPFIITQLLSIIERFYVNSSKEDRIIRKILFMDCYNPNYYIDGCLYSSQSGLPSGHFLTSIVNTLFNRVLQRMSYATIYNDLNMIRKFDLIPCVCNGDDSLVSVSDKESEIINEENFSKVMKDFGVIYTSDTKDGTFSVRNLHEITYLKRSFRYDNILKRYVAPLKLSRLLQFPDWMKKGSCSVEFFQQKLHAMITELSLHEESVFEKYIYDIRSKYKLFFGIEIPNTSRVSLLSASSNMLILPFVFQSGNTLGRVKNSRVEDLVNSSLSKSFLHTMVTINNDFDEGGSVPKRRIYHHRVNVYQMNTSEVKVDNEQDTVMANAESTEITSIPNYLGTSNTDVDFLTGSIRTDLARWAAKPSIVAATNLTLLDTPTTFPIFAWDHTLKEAMLANKFSGVFSVKADLVLTLTCNGNPFQQGLYALYFIYSGGNDVDSAFTDRWHLLHRSNKTHVTQLPHCKIDVNRTSEVKLRIPWKSAYNSCLVGTSITTMGAPGHFGLYPLVPLQAVSGSTTVGVSLFAHYENIEVGAVTVPQSGNMSGMVRTRRKPRDKDMYEKEASGLKISTVLDTAGQVTEYMAGIPLLSAIAAPSSVILRAGAKIASAFGFSKPTLDDPTRKVVKQYFPGMSAMSGEDVCESLSTTRLNHVGLHPEITGSDLDEMSIDFLKQIPAWRYTTNWTSSFAEDVTIQTINIDPGVFTSTTDSGVTLRHYAPVGYVNRFFDMWRGSMIIKIKIVSTPLHSGRLLAVFQPVREGVSSIPAKTAANSQYCLRTIIDIRDKTDIMIEVPFVSVTPWIKNGKYSGQLSFVVLDPLVHPATVANNVDLFIEIAGGKDMQFAAPRSFPDSPVIPSSYQSDNVSGEAKVRLWSGGIGNAVCNSPYQEVCSVTQGEAIVSLRQMIKRYYPYIDNEVGGNNTTTYALHPFSSFILKCNGTTLIGGTSNPCKDLYSHCTAMYAFGRGSVRYNAIPLTPSIDDGLFVSFDNISTVSPEVNTLFAGTVENFDIYWNSINGTGVGFTKMSDPNPGYTVPQNTATLSRVNMTNLIDADTGLKFGSEGSDLTRLRLRQTGSSPTQYVIARSAGDDCSFACFVTVPPFVITSS